MSYATDHIATALKEARLAKGISQRALSDLSGVPQSHISKIENGGVDLRVSSLVELARVLGLELTLVPRKSVPAVNSVVRNTEPSRSQAPGDVLRELKRMQSNINAFKDAFPASTELAQVQRHINDLKHLNVSTQYLNDLREINKSFKSFKSLSKNLAADLAVLQQPLQELQQLRNSIVHSGSFPMTTKVRPAYTLEEEDEHGG